MAEISRFLRVEVKPGPPAAFDTGPVFTYKPPSLIDVIVAISDKLHTHIHVTLPNNYW